MFVIEITLIAIIFKIVVIDKPDFRLGTPNLEVVIVRFIAAFLLHMELISDVKQGLDMINYLNAHPKEFTNRTIPFIISVMQSLGGLIAEATNLFMIATRESVADCITFFVAFHVLTAIDNIY